MIKKILHDEIDAIYPGSFYVLNPMVGGPFYRRVRIREVLKADCFDIVYFCKMSEFEDFLEPYYYQDSLVEYYKLKTIEEKKSLFKLSVYIRYIAINYSVCPPTIYIDPQLRYFTTPIDTGHPLSTIDHLSINEKISLFLPVIEFHQRLQTEGIYLRYLKPSNLRVMLDDSGKVKNIFILDFLLAIDWSCSSITSEFLPGIPEPPFLRDDPSSVTRFDLQGTYILAMILNDLIQYSPESSDEYYRVQNVVNRFVSPKSVPPFGEGIGLFKVLHKALSESILTAEEPLPLKDKNVSTFSFKRYIQKISYLCAVSLVCIFLYIVLLPDVSAQWKNAEFSGEQTNIQKPNSRTLRVMEVLSSGSNRIVCVFAIQTDKKSEYFVGTIYPKNRMVNLGDYGSGHYKKFEEKMVLEIEEGKDVWYYESIISAK